MPQKRTPVVLTILGALLTLGPILGAIGTAFGMFRAFNRIAGDGMGKPEALAADINIALVSTAAGLLLFPVGVVLLILGVRGMIRARKEQEQHGISN